MDRAHAEQAIQRFNGQCSTAGRWRSAKRARVKIAGPAVRRVRRAALRARARPAAASRRVPRRSAVRRGRSIRRRPPAPRQPQLRARRQAAARRQRQGQEEGSRAAARSDSAEGHRPLVHARRRLDRTKCRRRTSTISRPASRPTKEDEDRRTKTRTRNKTRNKNRTNQWIVPPESESLGTPARTGADGSRCRGLPPLVRVDQLCGRLGRSDHGLDRIGVAPAPHRDPLSGRARARPPGDQTTATPTSASSSPASTTMTTKIRTICESSVAGRRRLPCHALQS